LCPTRIKGEKEMQIIKFPIEIYGNRDNEHTITIDVDAYKWIILNFEKINKIEHREIDIINEVLHQCFGEKNSSKILLVHLGQEEGEYFAKRKYIYSYPQWIQDCIIQKLDIESSYFDFYLECSFIEGMVPFSDSEKFLEIVFERVKIKDNTFVENMSARPIINSQSLQESIKQSSLQSIDEISIDWVQSQDLEYIRYSDDYSRIPQDKGVYFFVGKRNGERRIDVGQTHSQNFEDRIRQHFRDNDYLEYCGEKEFIFCGVVKFPESERFKDEEWKNLLEQLEGELIQFYSNNEKRCKLICNDSKRYSFMKHYRIRKIINKGLDDFFPSTIICQGV